MHFQLLLTICTPRTIHNLRRVEKTYIIIYFCFLSVGDIFATKHSKKHIGISLFMQCPKMDIPPIVQFEIERYSIAGYKIAQNQQ